MDYKDSDSNSAILNRILDIVCMLQRQYGKIETDVARISKLESNFQTVVQRIDNIERKFVYMMNKTKQIEDNNGNMNNVMHKVVDKCKENISSIATLEEDVNAMKQNDEIFTSQLNRLDEDVIDLKCRSMDNNLIFTGIKYQSEEDAENVLKNFIETRLGIKKSINFVKVHRFGKRPNHGNRPIVAKFVNVKDQKTVLSKSYKLKGTHFGIKRQFPKEIENKRKSLYPVLKESKKNKKKATIVRDKLYVEGNLYRQGVFPNEQSKVDSNEMFSISSDDNSGSCISGDMNTNQFCQQHIRRRKTPAQPGGLTVHKINNDDPDLMITCF